ncbi:hypothetical protein [Yoonia sp.]|uniref:hypothetical protein n=1 Tax=Yoonia sp. TaxID=2212373 RepID=UPI002FDAB3DD
MLELDATLPEGALIGSERAAFAEAIARTGAIWFRGDWDAFEIDNASGAIKEWRSADGNAKATPANPNEGHGLLAEVGPYSGLRCVPEVNCGLVAEKVTESAGTFSMAVIYHPPAEDQAKTLLTVNTGYTGGTDADSNYLYLSDAGDFFTVKDTRGAVEVVAPVTSSPDGLRMAVVTLCGNRLAVAENLAPPTIAEGADAGMRTGADLFIGCRSHRSGLKKTLGGATILEVLFWPKHALLTPRGAEDTAAYLDLKRYFLWEY